MATPLEVVISTHALSGKEARHRVLDNREESDSEPSLTKGRKEREKTRAFFIFPMKVNSLAVDILS